LAGLPIKQHPTPEHRAYAISFKFHSCEHIHQADCLTPSLRNQVTNPYKACGYSVSLNIQNNHRWLGGLPGYLTLFTTHPFVHQSQFCIERCLCLSAFLLLFKVLSYSNNSTTTPTKFHFIDIRFIPSKYPIRKTKSNKDPTHPLGRFLLGSPRTLWLTAIAGTELIRS